MELEAVSTILRTEYGINDAEPQFLRESGGTAFIVNGPQKRFLKIIGSAFEATARQSVSVARYLEKHMFPVPKTVLSLSGEELPCVPVDGETRPVLLQEFIDGDEPDLKARARDVGALTGKLHCLLERYPGRLTRRGREFFIGRYLDLLRRKEYPRLSEYKELGETLWRRVEALPGGNCHGDLHRGNLIEAPDRQIYFLDFDTVCNAPMMFDISVMCDMTDYFRLKQEDIDITRSVYERFLSGYTEQRALSLSEERSFYGWVAVRHFQLQATILEIYGIDCVNEQFIDSQLDWLEQWLRSTGS